MFYVQVNMDDQSIMDLVKSINENARSSSKLLPDKDMVLDKGSQKKSLGNLAIKFVDLLQNSSNGEIQLDKVVDLLLLCAVFTLNYKIK